ncbi:MAG: twin-arginine translocation signal domain-containing protein [Halobacteriales archaeon]
MKRRRFLKGSSALFVAGATGLSGCAGLGDESDGTSTVGTDRLEGWLPAPRALDSDLDHYQFNAVAPAALSKAVNTDVFGRFDQDTTPQNETSADVNVGTFPASAIDLTFSTSASTGAETYSFRGYFGSFESDWLKTKILNNGYDRISAEGDFTLYNDEDNTAGSRVTAISKKVLIAGAKQVTDPGSNADAVPLVETIIETGQGRTEGYADQLEDMSALMSGLPGGHQFSGSTFDRVTETNPENKQFENFVGEGETRRVVGSATKVTKVLVFLSAADVFERDIEQYIESSGDFADFSKKPEYKVDGRVVTVEGRSA